MIASNATAAAPAVDEKKPADNEIDVFGLTHQGKVRKNNQDHFLLCSLRKQLHVYQTSLTDVDLQQSSDERVAFLGMVADGVGGRAMGEAASRLAVQAITDYVTRAAHCYYAADARDTDGFAHLLHDGALKVHDDVVGRAQNEPELSGMATTLTVLIGVWPCAYLVHVGDSRCYLLRDGVLRQISRDQTMAQDLVDQGVLPAATAPNTRWAHVLSSSIGGSQTAPIVTRFQQQWGDVALLCSDGLTIHVPDEQIADRLQNLTSSRQACEQLLEDALSAGGLDNITILVGRTKKGGAS